VYPPRNTFPDIFRQCVGGLWPTLAGITLGDKLKQLRTRKADDGAYDQNEKVGDIGPQNPQKEYSDENVNTNVARTRAHGRA
jgi:hypothetical protein